MSEQMSGPDMSQTIAWSGGDTESHHFCRSDGRVADDRPTCESDAQQQAAETAEIQAGASVPESGHADINPQWLEQIRSGTSVSMPRVSGQTPAR
jgi:hypothetical protein